VHQASVKAYTVTAKFAKQENAFSLKVITVSF